MSKRDDLKSSIYSEDSINELIQSLSEHLKFKSSSSSRCNPNGNISLSSNNSSSAIDQDKTHSPYYYSPNNSLSSTASDLIHQQQQSVATETYFLMENLLKNGNLIKEAVRRLKFGNQQIAPEQTTNQAGGLLATKQYKL